jgi:exosortase A-associated hydrolase 2
MVRRWGFRRGEGQQVVDSERKSGPGQSGNILPADCKGGPNPDIEDTDMELPISFFLPGPAGNLFAMYYPPAETGGDSGDVLYVHPFAGEMFASRHLIAALARGLASEGLGVLTVDLYGCGDSSGDFSDARWEIWRDDLTAAVAWLQARGRDRLSLWGLRLGALLAMDFAARSSETYEKIVLWQPVVTGRNMLTQFFRMNLDEADRGLSPAQLTDPEARRSLPDGNNIEVAGYELSRELIREIDNLEIAALGKAVSGPIHWMEVSDRAGNPFHPETLRVIEEWKQRAVRVITHKSVTAPFWLFPHTTDPARLERELIGMFRDEYGNGK